MDVNPVFKQRSFDTNNQHLQFLNSENKNYTHLMLGDSMLENFLNMYSGLSFFKQIMAKVDIFNAGVGGDKVENVLYRVIEGKLLDHPSLKTVKCVYLLLGTNNLNNKNSACKDTIINGISKLVDLLINRLPHLETIHILKISPRTDINQYLIDEVNLLIAQYIEDVKQYGLDANITLINWTDKLYDNKMQQMKKEYFYDNVHLNTSGYEIMYDYIMATL